MELGNLLGSKLGGIFTQQFAGYQAAQQTYSSGSITSSSTTDWDPPDFYTTYQPSSRTVVHFSEACQPKSETNLAWLNRRVAEMRVAL